MKKNSTILRIIAMLMLSVMMISAFAACADTGTGETSTDPNANAGTTAPIGEATTDNRDENGYELDDLPELDYKQTTINILAWKDVEHEEFNIAYEDLSGDIVEQSLYDRNDKVEQRLNVTLNFNRDVDGDADHIDAWNAYINNSVSITGREFDIIAGYSLAMAAAAVNGYLYNMLDDSCEYLNFEQPWWSELLLEQATFGDNLYFASGDISRNALEMMYVCYANTDLLDTYQLSNPQELVESGDWTYEQFIQMCQGVYKDDGDGVKNCDKGGVGDVFGYITSGIHVDPWFYGTGATICERNPEGEVIQAASFSDQRVSDTIDMLCDLLEGEFGIYTSAVYHQRAFGLGNALFMMDRARVSHKVLAADYGETKFVILPCPKFDKDTEKYITVMGNPFTLYAIASDIQEPAMAAAFVECFASEGFRKVTPAVFEISLKTRYVDDPLSGRMYDIIRANITYDVGRIFSDSLIGQKAFRDAVANHQAWGSVAKQAAAGLKRALPKLNAALNP